MHVVIFANGAMPDPQADWTAVQTRETLVIAADGGTRHALAAGVIPHVVIGDLDSLSQGEQTQLREADAEIVRFPPRKDETDLELALLHAVRAGATEIVILGALGGRLDQTIANVLLLTMQPLHGVKVRIVEGAQEALLIRDEALIEGRPGDTVSLIPWGGDAEGVTASGLEWPLHQETLHVGPARGVSNVLQESPAPVSVQDGMLLCVVIHGAIQKESNHSG